MQIDPVEEWRRLTEHYRQMSNVQLEELALDFADLTEMAQQVLRDELRHRGLPHPGDSTSLSATAAGQAQITFTLPEFAPDESRSAEDADPADSEPLEFTWKIILCECEEWDQVWQLREMLRRAGIESWSQGPGGAGLVYPRILVAADQLEEARAVIAKPVPQDVIDESHEPTPEYEMPRCPTCRDEDPILEATDPVNTWLCESCGKEWTDPAPAGGAELRRTGT
jgi:hypothetical protein